jgi:hypothetical protein
MALQNPPRRETSKLPLRSMIAPKTCRVLFALGIFSFGACVAPKPKFPALYDHYFPKHSPYVTSDYRRWFDRTILNPSGRSQLAKQEQKLYDAVRGDSAAFHAFVHSEFREGAGEFSESWHYECLLLLLVLGDQQFAEQLVREDRKTKVLVGAALASQLNWHNHPFPKTRDVLAAHQ